MERKTKQISQTHRKKMKKIKIITTWKMHKFDIAIVVKKKFQYCPHDRPQDFRSTTYLQNATKVSRKI